MPKAPTGLAISHAAAFRLLQCKKIPRPVTGMTPLPNYRADLNDVEDELKAAMLAALAGDNLAYAGFLKRCSLHLRAYFRRRLSAFPDDVEDLVQDTLLA